MSESGTLESQSFSPNRLMFDLETLKDQTVRMIEVLEKGEELDGPQE